MNALAEHIESFVYNALPGRVLFGVGYARHKLGEEIERLGVERILLVVAPPEAALAEELLAPVAGRHVATFDRVKAHVPVDRVRQGLEMARDCHADCLLSVGGGSTTGMAKAIALETGLPIICIPTTYAGSEMTPVYGMTQDNRKITGRSLGVLPRVVLYDPELTLSLPDDVTGPSAINALAHCVEGFYAAGASPMTSLMALEGIRAIADGLPDTVLNPQGIEGRSKTLYGAYMAGATFAVAGSGIHHKICHVLGGAYDLPHAQTHTVVLPHVAALNRGAIPHVMADIADALGRDDAAEGLFDLNRSVGAPVALRDIGMQEKDLDEAVRLCLDAVPDDNPVRVDEKAMRQLLLRSFAGQRPLSIG